jgi:2-polyprenyl-3-methyl-5-hydroxy-6-metoxy-1,4-benzoquinol methylase
VYARRDAIEKMPDNHYTDPRMVALYDTLCRWSEDRDFYVSLADENTKSVLDAGCGTGLVTVAFVRDGRRVAGVDPAQGMLDVARTRPDGDRIEWHCSQLQDFKSNERFDLVYMTGHAFQCLLTDEDILAAFRSVASLLSPEGHFVFETRNPDARGWLKWQPETSRVTGQLPDGTHFMAFHELVSVALPYVTFDQLHFIGSDSAPLRSRSTLRFATADEIASMAAEARLHVDAVWGDWDRSPLAADCPEIIVSLRLV